MNLNVNSLQIKNISMPHVFGNSLQNVSVEDRYMAGVALYNNSQLTLVSAQFSNFTAPTIIQCNCSQMAGYSVLAIVSAEDSTTANIADSTFESFWAGNAGVIPGYVSGPAVATGGNTAIFGVAHGSAAISVSTSTYNFFRNGDGEQPFDTQVQANCTAGGDFLVLPQGTITNSTIAFGASPAGTQVGRSCFSPCTPKCDTGQTCGFDGKCSCYPFYVSSRTMCVLNNITDCNEDPEFQLLHNGGFEDGDIFSYGLIVPSNPGGCGNKSLSLSSTYSPSGLVTNFNFSVGHVINVSFWTRGTNLGQPSYVNITFANENTKNENTFYLGPGTYGWNKQSLAFTPSFNVTQVVITLEVESGEVLFDNFAIYGVQSCSMSCGPLQECLLLGGFPTCICLLGYQMNLTTKICEDINECVVHNGGCDPHVTCNNTSPGFYCPPCPPLFTGNSSSKCSPLCGDYICEPSIGENCVSCPFDCTASTCSQCGDGKCDELESCITCFDDCQAQCALKQCQVRDCSGHGTCLDGTCYCSDNWSGPGCKVDNIPVIVTAPTPDPVVTVTSSPATSFSISISNIQERRPDNTIVQQFDLQNFAKTTNETTHSTIWYFTATLDNDALVNITIQFFNDYTTGNFANKTNSFAANTIKFNVGVKSWPFKALQNTLAILIGAANPLQATRSCNLYSNTNSNGSLTWYTLTINGVAMYGQFAPEAILDGRNRIITFYLNSENGEITAVVPHFWEEMDLDPTFSVLVGKASDTCKKHRNINKKIYIAVFVSLGVLIIVGVGGYFMYPKLRTFHKVRKSSVELQSMPSADENAPVIEKAQDMEVYTHAGKYTVRM